MANKISSVYVVSIDVHWLIPPVGVPEGSTYLYVFVLCWVASGKPSMPHTTLLLLRLQPRSHTCLHLPACFTSTTPSVIRVFFLVAMRIGRRRTSSIWTLLWRWMVEKLNNEHEEREDTKSSPGITMTPHDPHESKWCAGDTLPGSGEAVCGSGGAPGCARCHSSSSGRGSCGWPGCSASGARGWRWASGRWSLPWRPWGPACAPGCRPPPGPLCVCSRWPPSRCDYSRSGTPPTPHSARYPSIWGLRGSTIPLLFSHRSRQY